MFESHKKAENMLDRKYVVTVASLFVRTAMAGGMSQDSSTDGFSNKNVYAGLAIIGLTLTGIALYCMRSHLPRCCFNFGGNSATQAFNDSLIAEQERNNRSIHQI